MTLQGEQEPAEKPYPLHINSVIQVIGSRGYIQPFVALGKELKKQGHRVRVATHERFREFVLQAHLEFFDIGGDPEKLMAFMVSNPTLIPDFHTIRSRDIQKRREEVKEIINGCWKSCYGPDEKRNFVADAMANPPPPSLAHIHYAQRLGRPLHIMFTWVQSGNI